MRTTPFGHVGKRLELAPAPSMKVEDLFLPTFEGLWESGGVLGVLARSWQEAEPHGIRRTPEGLAASLALTQWPPDKVLAKAAALLEVQQVDLERYLRAAPWRKEDQLVAAEFPSKRVKDNYLTSRGYNAHRFEYHPPPRVELEEEIHAADFDRHISTLLNFKARVMGVDDFLRTFKPESGVPGRDGRRGYLLGPSMLGNKTDSRLSWSLNLRNFVNGYERYFTSSQSIAADGRPRPMTDEYMNLITASGEPIIFLVPPGGLRGNTLDEFQWLLDHPARLETVTFVFGAFKGQ